MSRYIDAEYVNAFPIRIDHYDEEHGNRHFVLGIESVMEYIEEAPHIDIVRCKECKWYDSPHILHNDGTRTDVDEDAPWVTIDVGINCGGQCIHHIDLKTYCVNHDRENPDDNERIVIFRKPDDFCSYGERKESE